MASSAQPALQAQASHQTTAASANQQIPVHVGQYPPAGIPGMPTVNFRSYRYMPPRADVKTSVTQMSGGSSITLFLPGGYNEKVGAQWGPEEIIGMAFSDQKMSFAASDALAGLAKAIPTVKSTAAGYLGKALAPNEILVFQKTSHFDLTFNYSFMPIDKAEAGMMLAAIDLFKKSVLPTLVFDKLVASLDYPPVWSIKVNLKGAGAANSGDGLYTDMALVDFSVTYSEGSTSALVYWDGTPVQASMSLAFKSIKTAYNGEK